MMTTDKAPREAPRKETLYIWLTVFLAVLINSYFFSVAGVKTVPYSEFLELVDEGKPASVTIEESRISWQVKGSKERFATVPAKDDNLPQKLYEKKIPFEVKLKSPFVGIFFSWVLPILFFYLIWSYLARRVGGSATGLLSMTKSKAKAFVEKDIKTTFSDVAGIDEAKGELLEIVDFLQDPTRYTRLGGRAPKGVLLIGPPGTGKTLLARAVAGEAKVPFFSINGSEFVEMFVGLGAARVRDLFEQARKQAPCILFIDEIDALGKSRAFGLMGTGSSDEKEQTLNQLLAEMDGFDSSEGVIMLAATNRPEILDPALLRAGRFDRQIMLNKPDQQGRLQILGVHAKKIKLDPEVDLGHIASMTPGFSGADIANLVNEAALVATRRNAESVAERDFSEAIERIVAGLEKKTKLMNPEEKKRVAHHELGHATVALALDVADKVHKVSIIPRGVSALGYTLQRPLEDRYLLDEGEIIEKIAVLLGGRAAEAACFEKVSTGAADDLAKATEIARSMVVQFGMSEALGLASFDMRRSPFLQAPFELSQKPVSEGTAREIDLEVKSILEKAYQVALGELKRHRAFFDAAVVRLMEKETLDETEIASLWGRHKERAA